MATRPASETFSAAELACGGIIARCLYVLSAALLVGLMTWSAGSI